MPQVVLITGCSTGIGRDLAERLTQSGYAVVATARRAVTLDQVPAALKLPLDVTQPDSIHSAVEHTLQRMGRIDVLVNNAGYALRGAVEEVLDAQVQQMFDVNVYGVMRMIRAVAPSMRKQKAGRIINIGSLGGKVAMPVNGTYSATKFALEALSDAARLELASFGIQVVLIQPGNIRTQFVATAQEHAQSILSNSTSPYFPLYRQYIEITSALRRHDPGPQIVSQVVEQAIVASHPRARYPVAVPLSQRLMLFLGDSARDAVFKRMFKIPMSK